MTSRAEANGAANRARRTISLLFADDGEFHSVSVRVPADRLEQYDRLIDLIREDPEVTRQLYVDMRRLVSASIVEEEDGSD